MSVWITPTLVCDDEACRAEFHVRVGETVKRARTRAEEVGWGADGKQDWCPRCYVKVRRVRLVTERRK